MEIRTLRIDDYDRLAGLWTKAGLPFKPKGRDSKETITAQMSASPQFFLGAFDNDKLVGVVVLSCDLRKGWINRLAVDPDYQHQGIAKALIAESERTFREMGVRIFCALIDSDNAPSRRLFKRCGYLEHQDIVYFSKRCSNDI